MCNGRIQFSKYLGVRLSALNKRRTKPCNVFSALRLYANKTNSEAPNLLRADGNQIRIDGEKIPLTLLFLPPNAPMRGAEARSAAASAPLAG